jgi:hypothetical protein
MLLTALLALIGLVMVIGVTILIIHFDRRDRTKRQAER